MPPRPRREDIPKDVDTADVLHELRIFRWEMNGWHEEDHRWLAGFRSKVSDGARVMVVLLPVFVTAVIAIHLFV